MSVVFHGSLVIFAFLGPEIPGGARKPRSLYDTVIAPNQKKLIWYRFPQKLPEVSPLKSSESGPRPMGMVRSPQSIVANPPKAKSGKQMIWLKAPELHVEEELKAPNLLAFSPAPVLLASGASET